MDFPALTLCNPRGHNTGEYVRSVFNNLDFYLEDPTFEWQTDSNQVRKLVATNRNKLRMQAHANEHVNYSLINYGVNYKYCSDYSHFLDGAVSKLFYLIQGAWASGAVTSNVTKAEKPFSDILKQNNKCALCRFR